MLLTKTLLIASLLVVLLATWDIRHAEATTVALIDVQPTSDSPNPVPLKRGGLIPVAILGSASLDVSDVDFSTILFQGLSPFHRDGHIKDINNDAYLDYVTHYKVPDMLATLGSLSPGDVRTVSLTGQLFDDSPIYDSDTILIVPRGAP